MEEDSKIGILEKRCIAPIAAGISLVFILFKYVLGGIAYATAAFFTRVFWEKWKSRKKD